MKTKFKFLFAFVLLITLFVACHNEPIDEPGIKIGITYGTSESLSYMAGYDMLKNYRNAIKDNGAIPIKLSVNYTDQDIEEILSALDGLLIPGGVDVDPELYGEEAHENLELIDTKLDALEMKALQFAEENNLPVLGICRGLQIINVFKGGTLYQDIPTQLNSDIIHRDKENGAFHDIHIEMDTKLYEIFNVEILNVNSSHHQAVKEPGYGLIISAVAPDGVVEGFESNSDQFILGVQFHPEKLISERPVFNEIFKTLVIEAGNGK